MLTDSVAEGSPPYVGTRPFGIGDDRIFFGRDREIEELSELWQKRRLTVLHGGAGVGKTSLVCAGVVPRLRAQGMHVLPLGQIWRRNVFPAAAFPEQNLFTLALLSSWYPDESPVRVAGLSVLNSLRRHGSKDRFGAPVRTFAVIDQAELLFRRPMPHEGQRRRFLDQLEEALTAEPNLRLLLAGRDEYLDDLLAFGERLGEGACTDYPLHAFDRDAAVQAVHRPLTGTGKEPGREVAESLVDELRTVRTPWSASDRRIPTVAPALLQLVCARLWAGPALPTAFDTGTLPERLASDVDEVLGEFCGQALATVATDRNVSLGKLVSWFRTTFADRGSGGGVTEDRLDAGLPAAVLRALEDEHLVRASVRAGVRTYELHHPRMIEPVQPLDERSGPVRRPEPPERLRAAERALCVGDLSQAWYGAEAVIRACGADGLRLRAEAEHLLGNIARERGLADLAVEHYRSAVSIFEVLQDGRAVGLLLAALGRLLMDGSAADAVRELRTAASRLPNDLVVQIALAQALWGAGQPTAALAVLDTVLAREGDTPEALRARGEMLIDLGQIDPGWRDLRRIDHLDRPSTRAAWILAETERSRAGAAAGSVRAPRSGVARGDPEGGAAANQRAEADDHAAPRDRTEAPEPPEAAEAVGENDGIGVREWLDPAEILGEAAESGPVLLRIARVRGLLGQEDAAVFAAQAMKAGHPPLPAHLRDRARLLRDAGSLAQE
ncbi:tetratricopeptide repeat protein [Spirillospora sp. CA-255316]